MFRPEDLKQTPDLEQLRTRVEAETGMDLSGTRFPRLRAAVARLLSRQPAPGPANPSSFLERLTSELTVGESYFFRNEFHFRALRDHVLPSILADNAGRQEVRVWSAGCATGEEPYSLAIVLDEMVPPNWHASVLATDLNLGFLEKALQGRYRPWSFRQTSIHRDRRLFAAEGEEFVLSPRVRRRVRFAYLNLVKDVYPAARTGTLGLDLIVFRNVAIYLRPEVTRAIIERFRHALRPGGWLLLGEVELPLAPTAGFEARVFDQATFFRKPAGGPASAGVSESVAVPALAAVRPSTVPRHPEWVPLPWSGGLPRATSTPPVRGRHSEAPLSDRPERALLRRNFAEAEAALAGVAVPRERAAARLHCVRILLRMAEGGRARAMLDVSLREEPLSVEAHLLRASLCEEDSDLNAAEQGYRRALYVDRLSPMAHFHLGLVLRQKGDTGSAARSLRTTLTLIRGKDPQAMVEYGEGVCYGRLGEMAAMILSGM